ncbi:3'-5' exonuclease [Amycolatopsis jejuensis]|uniref:3'-5' exonuclease n=1 Tax=Amycolatopsis jejuensis TaxID=330084 RepID=UPI000AF5EE96|nr:3'-5' exonuclease [Amycolatopsis jejuensis]
MAELIDRLSLSAAGQMPAGDVEFTAIDVKATGLRTGRIVELAAIRFRGDGTFLGEFASVVSPGRKDRAQRAPRNPHRIAAAELAGAPDFADLLGPLLDLCQDAIVVADDLTLVDSVLAAEVRRLGIQLPRMPGISLRDTAQATLRLPNYRLATVARAFGIADFPGYLAAASARACARAVIALVGVHGLRLAGRPRLPELPLYEAGAAVVRRSETGAEKGWMAEVVDRVPATGGGAPAAQAYLDLLAEAVGDEFLSDDEVWSLAGLAAEAGLPEAEVRRMHADFVAALRTVAESDGVVTAGEGRELRQVADALGVPQAVADLRVTASGRKATRVLVLGTSAGADQLRARVLAEGVQLAQKLTGSVTHLVYDSTVRDTEPRLTRALELGARTLGLDEAPVQLGFETEPQEIKEPQTAPTTKRFVGVMLMGTGLLMMILTIVALFTGAGLGAGIVMAVFGVGALVGGWYLNETNRLPAV